MIKNYQTFKESVNTIIQNSGLDIGIVYFILKDTFREVKSIVFKDGTTFVDIYAVCCFDDELRE